jgi:hypothetical protein
MYFILNNDKILFAKYPISGTGIKLVLTLILHDQRRPSPFPLILSDNITSLKASLAKRYGNNPQKE